MQLAVKWQTSRCRLMMHFLPCILILHTCLIHIQSCLSCPSPSPLGSESFCPPPSVFAVVQSCLSCPSPSSLGSVCFCSPPSVFAVLRPPVVSSSLGCACFCPPQSVFAVLRPPFVSSSLESVWFCPHLCLLSSDTSVTHCQLTISLANSRYITRLIVVVYIYFLYIFAHKKP